MRNGATQVTARGENTAVFARNPPGPRTQAERSFFSKQEHSLFALSRGNPAKTASVKAHVDAPKSLCAWLCKWGRGCVTRRVDCASPVRPRRHQANSTMIVMMIRMHPTAILILTRILFDAFHDPPIGLSLHQKMGALLKCYLRHCAGPACKRSANVSALAAQCFPRQPLTSRTRLQAQPTKCRCGRESTRS